VSTPNPTTFPSKSTAWEVLAKRTSFEVEEFEEC